MTEIAIIGAGGHAKVVIEAVRSCNCKIAAIYDDRREVFGSDVLGVPVQGEIGDFQIGSMPCVVAIGSNSVRKEIVSRLAGAEFATVVHASAIVSSSAMVSQGAFIAAGAVIQAEARIMRHVIVNTSASIDHDCSIADFVHIGPGSHLAGNVNVGEGSFLGIASAVIPRVSIGEWTTIGAGGVVIRDLPDYVLATGVPAEIRKSCLST